jgi:hypothetical protein
MILLGAALGIVANYMRLWARNDVQGSLWSYLRHQSPRATVSACVAALAGIAAVCASGAVPTGWSALAAGFGVGFAADATCNRGAR